MTTCGSTVLESMRRSRMLSRERLVQVVTRTVLWCLLKQWMRRRMSSVLPVPGMPSIRHSGSPDTAFRKAQLWSEFRSYRYSPYCCYYYCLAYFSYQRTTSYSSSTLTLSCCVSSITNCLMGWLLLTRSSTALLMLASAQLAKVYISSWQSMACSSMKVALFLLRQICCLFISMSIVKVRVVESTEVQTTLQPSSSSSSAMMHLILREGRQNSSKMLSQCWLAHLRSTSSLGRLFYSSRLTSSLLLTSSRKMLTFQLHWLALNYSCYYRWIILNHRQMYQISLRLKELSSERIDSCYLEGRVERSTVPSVFQMQRQESSQMDETSQQLHWEKVGGKGGKRGSWDLEVRRRMFCAIWLRCAITISKAVRGSSYLKNRMSESEQQSSPITGLRYFSLTSMLQMSVWRLCESLTLRPVLSYMEMQTGFWVACLPSRSWPQRSRSILPLSPKVLERIMIQLQMTFSMMRVSLPQAQTTRGTASRMWLRQKAAMLSSRSLQVCTNSQNDLHIRNMSQSMESQSFLIHNRGDCWYCQTVSLFQESHSSSRWQVTPQTVCQFTSLSPTTQLARDMRRLQSIQEQRQVGQSRLVGSMTKQGQSKRLDYGLLSNLRLILMYILSSCSTQREESGWEPVDLCLQLMQYASQWGRQSCTAAPSSGKQPKRPITTTVYRLFTQNWMQLPSSYKPTIFFSSLEHR